ncbi:cationic amino acid transporter 4-like, partial [Saccostrea cucullata]|uniref:cationic amino acid transporter 4-like n=1 Tax=Saccostrea cuccullata TaxID=36930 RepID=UPI002ED5067F
LGASSVARAWSGGLDSIFNGAIKNSTLKHIGYLSHDNVWLSDYPDFVAFAATVVVFIVVATGAKFAMNFNNIFTIINLIVIVIIIAMGFYYADVKNWTEHGGFFPHGFGGAWAGAATCFYAYIGFEGIATAGEEAKNPEKSIPIATILSLGTVTVLYVLVTSVLTLMVPYTDVDPNAAFPFAFAAQGAEWAKYVVALGTLFGITTSLLGGAFSLPRAVYSMAADGLLFQIFAYVHPKTQTPIWGILCFGLLSALMALLFEIETLVEFMSIGTILAYTIVAVSVIILRYAPVHKCQFKLKPQEEKADDNTSMSEESAIMKKSKSHDDFGKLKDHLRHLPILKSFDPGNATILAILLMVVAIICFCAILVPGYQYLADGAWWAIVLEIIFGAIIVLCFLILIAHEKNDAFLTFQIPFVPLIPCLSIFCNITLMMKLNYLTWIRLAIWLVIGLLVYFLYGVWHSRERETPQYGEIVGYTGDASISCSTISKMEEEIVQQQPKRAEGEEVHIGVGEL